MKSVDRLVAEHEIIERGLNLLEKAVTRIDSDDSVPDDFPKWAPAFFSQFADKCHHAKEEDLFFPLLRQHIFKENNVLFQMAATVLSDADDANMDGKFTQVEQDRDLAGMHERYDAEVARWEQELK